MKSMKPEEIRKLTAQQIELEMANKRDEIRKLRFQQVTGQLRDPSRVRHIRREIARMETILKEFERSAVEGVA